MLVLDLDAKECSTVCVCVCVRRRRRCWLVRRKMRFQDSSGLTCKGLKQAVEWAVAAGAEVKSKP